MKDNKLLVPGEQLMYHALGPMIDPEIKRDESTEDAAYTLINLVEELVKGCAAPNDVEGTEYRVKALRYWANVAELWDKEAKEYKQQKRIEIEAMTPEDRKLLERAVYVKLLEKGTSDKEAEFAIKAWKEGVDNSISLELLEKVIENLKLSSKTKKEVE